MPSEASRFRLAFIRWFWLSDSFALVLSIAVLVLAVSIVLFARFGDDISTANQSRQHRNDPVEQTIQSAVAIKVESMRCSKQILNRNTFQRRAASNIEKSVAIFQAPFAIALGNIQRNRLGGAMLLVACVAVKPPQIPCDDE